MLKQEIIERFTSFRLPGGGLVVVGLLVLALFAMPWLRLPYGGADGVAFGQPLVAVMQPATATATVTLTPTTTATATMTLPPPVTATATSSPTATQTSTATTAPPATRTSTPTSIPTATTTLTPPPAPPAGRDSLTARVFVDYRCDRYFQTNVDIPVGSARVTISFPDGSSATRETTLFGMVSFSGFDASGGLTVSVELPRNYRGYSLISCPGSPAVIDLEPTDFNFGFKFVSFGATVGGELAGP